MLGARPAASSARGGRSAARAAVSTVRGCSSAIRAYAAHATRLGLYPAQMHNAVDDGSPSEVVPTFDLPPAFAKALHPAPTAQNAVLVGLSLAAATGAIASLFGDSAGTSLGTACAGSTAIYGWFWWRLLMKNSNVWKRLLVSILLAAGNAATASLYAWEVLVPHNHIHITHSMTPIIHVLIIGITLGAIIWIPALLLTFAMFGYSIAQQGKAAQNGRDGVDYANQVTATTSVALGTAAVVMLAMRWELGWTIVTPLMFSLATMCAGLWTALDSANRLRTRRRFVLAVLEGKHPELIYQASDEGDFILRRTVEGTAYRQTEVATVLVRV
jgi:hypothetical protein